jgi:diaminobutyrate acetyltransferase
MAIEAPEGRMSKDERDNLNELTRKGKPAGTKVIRQMNYNDLSSVYELAHNTERLDIHTPYTYWVMLNSSPKLMLVAERDDAIVGFVGGLGAFGDGESAFVWQIGVHPRWQGSGIGSCLLRRFVDEALSLGFRSLVFTIGEDNKGSFRLFAKFAHSIGSNLKKVDETGSIRGLMKNENIYHIALTRNI